MPRVSPYRLAAHLASAFTIYALLAWTTLSLAFPVSSAGAAELSSAAAQALAALGARVRPVAALVALTALSGDRRCLRCTPRNACSSGAASEL